MLALHPSFNRTYEAQLARLQKKAQHANLALFQFNITWTPGAASRAITVGDLHHGVLALRELLSKKQLWLPKPIVEMLYKTDKLSNRDCAVVLKRTARWMGLSVETNKKQRRNADGSVSTTNWYTLR